LVIQGSLSGRLTSSPSAAFTQFTGHFWHLDPIPFS